MPLVPQYKSLDRAAAVETLAKPKSTRTMLGKQHMEARKADPPIHLHRDLTSCVMLPAMAKTPFVDF